VDECKPLHVGDVVTAVGEHFIDAAYPPLRCITGASMQAAEVVSSAVLRCVMPWGDATSTSTSAASTPHRSSAAGHIKEGRCSLALSNLT